MRKRWYYKPVMALFAALVCIMLREFISRQGYLTTKVWGADFGFARIKSQTFFVCFGENYRFPFDLLLLSLTVVAVGIAIAATRKHFGSNTRAELNPIA